MSIVAKFFEEVQINTHGLTPHIAGASGHMPFVQGTCPGCRMQGTLFLGSGGYVTCSSLSCPEPEAATNALDGAVSRVAALCDAAEREALRWADPLPVPEWVASVREALDGAA